MGKTTLKCMVMNPKDTSKSKELEFLVDTGSTLVVLPENVSEELSLEYMEDDEAEMINGEMMKFKYTFALFEYDGKKRIENIWVGPPNLEPIIGYHFLEIFKLVVDPINHTVKKGGKLHAK